MVFVPLCLCAGNINCHSSETSASLREHEKINMLWNDIEERDFRVKQIVC